MIPSLRDNKFFILDFNFLLMIEIVEGTILSRKVFKVLSLGLARILSLTFVENHIRFIEREQLAVDG